MTLDHDTGEMDGEVLAGRLRRARGCRSSRQAELQRLVAELDARGDEDSLSLLLAYLDRRRGAGAGRRRRPAGPR